MAEVKLPKAIQDEVDRAELIEQELAEIANSQITDAVTSTEEISVPEPELAPESVAEAPSEETPSALEDDPNSETWQSRYTVLQGKYSAEVPRYAQQLQEAGEYIRRLEAQLSARPSDPIVSTDRRDETDREAAELFGEDLVDYIRKRAQAEAERRVAEVKQSQQAVEQRIAQSEHERFFAQVDAAVPNWREIDQNPLWLGWLQEYDPMLGAPRQAAIQQAVQSRDVQRVAHLFNTFLGTQRPVNAPAQPPRALQEQVTPRPAGNASVASAPQARVYTQEEIKRLLDPRYQKTLTREQQAAIDRDIDLAINEGRVAA